MLPQRVEPMMMMKMAAAKGTILLIDRGDLPSLTAAVIQPDPARLVLWHLCEGDDASARRLAVVEQHDEILGVSRLIISDAWRADAGRAGDAPGLWQALLLVQAAIVARQCGCGRIIWPVLVGPDAWLVSDHVDRATTVTDLVLLEAGNAGEQVTDGSLVIDLPLVDLDDEQAVDLAEDCGAPLRAFWPCETGDSEPCGACGGCDRWQRAFSAVGLPWPWARHNAAMSHRQD